MTESRAYVEPRRTYRCQCGNRQAWRVVAYRHNRSAFNGYHWTPSDYSAIRCEPEYGGCDAYWRTKAAYVNNLPLADAVSGMRR